MTYPKDLTEVRFGRLVAVRQAAIIGKNAVWLCACDCGGEKAAYRNNLIRGLTQSCGCLHAEANRNRLTTHGGSASLEYGIWKAMRNRCSRPTDPAWSNYGGRGIRVCARWERSFAAFIRDMGSRPTRTTIERKDNDGDYSPGNCRWATYVEQAANRRSTLWVKYRGQEMTLMAACSLAGTRYGTALSRRHRGWPIARWLD